MSSIRLGRIVAWVIGLAASGGAWCSAATISARVRASSGWVNRLPSAGGLPLGR